MAVAVRDFALAANYLRKLPEDFALKDTAPFRSCHTRVELELLRQSIRQASAGEQGRPVAPLFERIQRVRGALADEHLMALRGFWWVILG